MNFCPKRKVFDPSFNHLLLSPKKKKKCHLLFVGPIDSKVTIQVERVGPMAQ